VLEHRPLWERPVLREAAGDTLRPGGFALTDRAAEFMGMLPGWRVLDVGCGLGATVGRLRSRFGAEAYGVEASAAQTGKASGSGMVLGRGDCLPFGNESFSALFCECVLSLFPDALTGLGEFHRVLEPGAFLALSDIHAQDDRSPESGSCVGRAKPFAETRALVETAGFEVLLVENHSRLLKELAAKLLFAGESGQGRGCRRRLGYYLMIARRTG